MLLVIIPKISFSCQLIEEQVRAAVGESSYKTSTTKMYFIILSKSKETFTTGVALTEFRAFSTNTVLVY